MDRISKRSHGLTGSGSVTSGLSLCSMQMMWSCWFFQSVTSRFAGPSLGPGGGVQVPRALVHKSEKNHWFVPNLTYGHELRVVTERTQLWVSG